VLDNYLSDKAQYTFFEDDGKTLDYKNGKYNKTTFTVKLENPNTITFEQQKLTTGYNTKIQSYTLKLHNTKAPQQVWSAKKHYKPVNSVEKVKQTKESYYYDQNTKTLYVNIPADEDNNVQIK
jgi:alpha-glucosidase